MANDMNSLQYKIFGPQGLAKLGGKLDWTTKIGAGKEEVTYPDISKSLARTKVGKQAESIRNALIKKLGVGYTAPEAVAKFGAEIATFLPKEAWETGKRAGEIAMSKKMGKNEKDIKQLVNVLPMGAMMAAPAVAGKIGKVISKPINSLGWDVASKSGGNKVVNKIAEILVNTGSNVGNEFKNSLSRAVLQGGTTGGLFSGAKAGAEGVLDDKKLRETIVNVLKQGAMGAGSGAVLGGALYGAGKGVGKVKEALKGIDPQGGYWDPLAGVNVKGRKIYDVNNGVEKLPKEVQQIMDKIGSTSIPDTIIKNSDGTYTLKYGYFYSHGRSPEKYAEALQKQIPGSKIVNTFDNYKAWPKDSTHDVTLTIPEIGSAPVGGKGTFEKPTVEVGSVPKWVREVLSNDESSSDKELLSHFIKEGVSKDLANQYVGKRNYFLSNIVMDNGSVYKPPANQSNQGPKTTSGQAMSGNVPESLAKTTYEGNATAHSDALLGQGKYQEMLDYAKGLPNNNIAKSYLVKLGTTMVKVNGIENATTSQLKQINNLNDQLTDIQGAGSRKWDPKLKEPSKIVEKLGEKFQDSLNKATEGWSGNFDAAENMISRMGDKKFYRAVSEGQNFGKGEKWAWVDKKSAEQWAKRNNAKVLKFTIPDNAIDPIDLKRIESGTTDRFKFDTSKAITFTYEKSLSEKELADKFGAKGGEKISQAVIKKLTGKQ